MTPAWGVEATGAQELVVNQSSDSFRYSERPRRGLTQSLITEWDPCHPPLASVGTHIHIHTYTRPSYSLTQNPKTHTKLLERLTRDPDCMSSHCLAYGVSEESLTLPWVVVYGLKLTAVVSLSRSSSEQISPCAKMRVCQQTKPLFWTC